jgi:HEPN domain-containing protein
VETPTAWFKRANDDLRFAKWGLTDPDPAATQVCYMAQQAVEKYLKGYLIAHGWQLERTHDVLSLLVEAIKHDERFREFEEDLKPFGMYVVEARYPGDIETIFSIEEAQSAVETAERLAEFIKTQTSFPPDEEGSPDSLQI